MRSLKNDEMSAELNVIYLKSPIHFRITRTSVKELILNMFVIYRHFLVLDLMSA